MGNGQNAEHTPHGITSNMERTGEMCLNVSQCDQTQGDFGEKNNLNMKNMNVGLCSSPVCSGAGGAVASLQN